MKGDGGGACGCCSPPSRRHGLAGHARRGGKWSCIGGAMSQVENTFALSMLMRRFRRLRRAARMDEMAG